MPGTVQLITGPMFSGKSTELQRRLRRHALHWGGTGTGAGADSKVVVLVVPRRDVRFDLDGCSATHDGARARADLVLDDDRLPDALAHPAVRTARVVGIEEGQFFRHLAPVCERLAAAGKLVIVAALSSDFIRRPFPSVAELLPLAEDVVRLSAVCHFCGADAAFTCRLSHVPDSAPAVLVGGSETYRAACRPCHPASAPLPFVVSVEGPPGCGKTSLLRLVERDPRFAGLATVVPEPVEDWPAGLLAAYYADMPRHSALFQLEALATRRGRVVSVAAAGRVPVLIVERSWEADRRCFADLQADTGLMPATDAAVYRDVSGALLQGLPFPLTAAFFLRASPETCFARVQGRRRPGEQAAGMDEAYLAAIVRRHEDWLLSNPGSLRVVEGDGNQQRDPDSAEAAEPLLEALHELCLSLGLAR